jgi:hypothetical protein
MISISLPLVGLGLVIDRDCRRRPKEEAEGHFRCHIGSSCCGGLPVSKRVQNGDRALPRSDDDGGGGEEERGSRSGQTVLRHIIIIMGKGSSEGVRMWHIGWESQRDEGEGAGM